MRASGVRFGSELKVGWWMSFEGGGEGVWRGFFVGIGLVLLFRYYLGGIFRGSYFCVVFLLI